MKTRCYLCKEVITITSDRPKICTNCKTVLAYLARNSYQADSKLAELKIRILALTAISKNPKISITDALRTALQINQEQQL